MQTRIRLHKNGHYIAEHKFLWLFWVSCYDVHVRDIPYPKRYKTENAALSDAIKYCEQIKTTAMKKQRAKTYKIKYHQCTKDK